MTTYSRQDSPGKRASTSSATPRAHGDTIINILVAVMFFGLLAFGIMWIMKTAGEAGQEYTTSLMNTKMRASDVTCQANLRSIGQCLLTYAASNESFPASQQELVNLCGSPRLFHCPDPNGGAYTSIPGMRGDMPDTSVVVYESEPAHHGRCHALLLGGQIVALTPDELQAALAATQTYRR
jgi:hypothetical protein